MPGTFYSCQYHGIKVNFFFTLFQEIQPVRILMILRCSTTAGHQFLAISGGCSEVTPEIDHRKLELIVSCVGYDRTSTIQSCSHHTVTTFKAKKLQKKVWLSVFREFLLDIPYRCHPLGDFCAAKRGRGLRWLSVFIVAVYNFAFHGARFLTCASIVQCFHNSYELKLQSKKTRNYHPTKIVLTRNSHIFNTQTLYATLHNRCKKSYLTWLLPNNLFPWNSENKTRRHVT